MHVILAVPPVWDSESQAFGVSALAAFIRRYTDHDLELLDFNHLPEGESENLRAALGSTIYRRFVVLAKAAEALASGSIGDTMDPERSLAVLDRATKRCAGRLLRDNPAVIGFSVNLYTYPFALLTACRIKGIDNDKNVVFGGLHATFLAQLAHTPGWEAFRRYLFSICDAVVMGEGEEKFLALLTALENGKELDATKVPGVATRYFSGGGWRAISTLNLDELPIPLFEEDHENLNESYPRKVRFEVNRGCVWQCQFCSESAYWKSYRGRDPRLCVEGLERLLTLFRGRTIELVGSGLHPCHNHTNSLLQAFVRDLPKFDWVAYSSLPGINDEFLELFKSAGCVQLSIGIESASSRIINWLGKRDPHIAVQETISHAISYGIQIRCSFQVGLPGESLSEALETLALVTKLKDLGVEPIVFEFCASPFSALWNTDCMSLMYNKQGFPLAPGVSMRMHRTHSQACWDSIIAEYVNAGIHVHQLPTGSFEYADW